MMFPKVYRDTVLKAKNGELGEEIQKFFIENLNGAIDISNVLGICSECGQYEKILDLTMYIPKKNIELPEKDYHYYMELEQYYEVFREYPHKCKKCSGNLKIVLHDESKKYKKNILCPNCKKYMIKKFIGYWD